MKLYLVTVNWHYETENHGIFNSPELAEDYIDGMVGAKSGPAYRIADGSMFQPVYRREDFDVSIFYLNGIVEEQDEEEKIKICGSTFTTKEKQLTFHCKNPEGHDGYHGDGRAIWGFSD